MKLIYSISKMIEFCKNNPVSGVIYIDLFISRYWTEERTFIG